MPEDEVHLSEKEISRIVYQEKLGVETYRTFTEYAIELGITREQLLNWLNLRRNVLDIGAGGAYLQKEFQAMQQNGVANQGTKIFSLDLRYALPEHLNDIRTLDAIYQMKSSIGLDPSYQGRAVAASWERIPLKSHTFDGILSMAAFPFYAKDEKQVRRAFEEMDRLLDRERGDAMLMLGGRLRHDSNKIIYNKRTLGNSEIFDLSGISDLNLHPKIELANEGNYLLKLSREEN